jgi:flagellar biosynthesis GTPase FlhF
MARKLPRWKVYQHEPIHRIEIFPRERGGNFDIQVVERKVLRRDIRGHCDVWEREQVVETPHSLQYMLEALKISDKQGAVLDLLQGGLSLMIGLSERYAWYRRRAEEKQRKSRLKNLERDKKRRARERAEEAKYRAERREEERRKKKAALQEERRKAALLKKEKQEELQAKKDKAEKERAIAKALAEKKKAELEAKKQQEAEEKFRADRYWKQDYRRQIEA